MINKGYQPTLIAEVFWLSFQIYLFENNYSNLKFIYIYDFTLWEVFLFEGFYWFPPVEPFEAPLDEAGPQCLPSGQFPVVELGLFGGFGFIGFGGMFILYWPDTFSNNILQKQEKFV